MIHEFHSPCFSLPERNSENRHNENGISCGNQLRYDSKRDHVARDRGNFSCGDQIRYDSTRDHVARDQRNFCYQRCKKFISV